MKSLIIILAPIVLESCIFIAAAGHASTVKNAEGTFTVENGAIPPDFGKNPDEIFLVIKAGRKSYDKYLIKAVEEEYQGKYEYTMFARIDQSKYADKNVYRYYFYYDPGKTVNMKDENGVENGISNTYKQFYVYDRETDTKYKTEDEFSKFAIAMKVYIKNLNEQRIKNQ